MNRTLDRHEHMHQGTSAAAAQRRPAHAEGRRRLLRAALLPAAGAALGTSLIAPLAAPLSARAAQTNAQRVERQQPAVRVTTVARGLERPWALAFLPDGRMLVTEKPGRMRIVSTEGKLSEPLGGVPEVAASGQGGLLELVLSPKFDADGTVYFTYADGGGWGSRTAVDRAVLDGQRLREVERVFTQKPAIPGRLHFGSRIAFAPDGNLFVVLGERYTEMRSAQSLDNHLGKVVRIRPDGSVPPDNPFVGRDGALPEIWSYGHRNPQAAAIHPDTGRLWMVEHGPRGGDEINVPLAGRNYGWPVISYGVDYSGLPIAEGTQREGMEQPIYYWDPSIAPSGMAFLTSDRYPGWKGNLFVGALKFQLLVRLELDGQQVLREERLLQDVAARIRDVRQGPDGLIYVLTDERDGRILRLDPA